LAASGRLPALRAKTPRPLNFLAMALLGVSAPAAALAAWVFVNPRAAVNPFPPPSAPVVLAQGAPPFSPTSAFPTFPPAWTATGTRTPTATRTPVPTATPIPSLTPTAAPPLEARIANIVGHTQALPLSCEARAAADWAAYFGVSVDELDFLHSLPLTDDPNTGFVGDVNGEWGLIPPDSYGVHAEPVAARLRARGLWAYARTGLTFEALQTEISAGQPVIAWVVGHVERGGPTEYTPGHGRPTVVARYEHTVIVVGYTPARVTVLDGRKTYSRPLDTFLQSWGVLGNMAIVYQAP
jgi:uncharacterized protein YvpB